MPNEKQIQLPGDTDRHSIIGTTGSGKTVFALWELSHRNFHLMPWVIFDFKMEESINGIQGANHLEIDSQGFDMPTRNGIHIVHPMPHDDVEPMLWEIWKRGNTGIYIDEGYMMGRNNKAFRAILTQGRSKHIPMIILSQRPTWMDTFVFTESQYFSVFRLQHKRDIRNVEEFVPADLSKRLPAYHSYYYDVGNDDLVEMRPVPDAKTILATFERRLRPRKEAI